VNLAAPGFIARVYQIAVPFTAAPGDESSLENAERVLAGEFTDPNTGLPYANISTPGPNPDGTFNVTGVVNFSATAGSGVDQGLFSGDQAIPGTTGSSTHFVLELLGFLDLPAGTTTLGVTYKTDVNNDDGYRLTVGIGANPKDAFAVQAGAYNPNKGTASAQVSVSVATAGLYPIRLVWWSGVRPADFEFYTVGGSGSVLVNDSSNPAAVKAYREATPTTAPYARKVRPFPGATDASSIPMLLVELIDQTAHVNTNSVALSLNGVPVGASIIKTSAVTTVSYSPSAPLALGSANTAAINFADDATTPRVQTQSWQFTVQSTFVLPAEPNPGVVKEPGFKYKVVQGTIENGIFPNTLYRAEVQLSGAMINPATGVAYINQALPGTNSDLSYDYTNTVNFNGMAAQSAHNFPADFMFPGIPGTADPGLGSTIDNFSVECMTYLELDAGTHTFAVNGDDGVAVYYQHDARDLFGNPLVCFNGGESDRTFSFIVKTNGLYPFRFVFWNGSGNVNCEWLSIDSRSTTAPNGMVLINDPTNTYSVKAWREMSVTRPYITAATPGPGQASVYLTDGKVPSTPVKVDVPIDSSIAFTIKDGTLSLVPASVVLKLNGAVVSPTVNTASGVTTIQYTPTQTLAGGTLYTVSLAYSDSGGNSRNLITQFITRKGGVNAGPLMPDSSGLAAWEAEDFDAVLPYEGTGGGTASGMVIPYRTWAFDNTVLPGYSGQGYMVAIPNAGFGPDPSAGFSPRVDYNVYFPAAGTYYLWIRGQGNNGSDDSFWMSLDGNPAPGVAKRSNGAVQGAAWAWTGNFDNPGSGRMSFEIAETGIHTINLFMREDGQKIDKFVLTPDVGFVPAGAGPAVTGRLAPALSAQAVGTAVKISWTTNLTDGYQLESKSSLGSGTWKTVDETPAIVGDSKVVTIANSTGEQFYRLRK